MLEEIETILKKFAKNKEALVLLIKLLNDLHKEALELLYLNV